ncbi:hypothetical protein [Rhodococcus ruber]|uniref:hypothetical protein n=1 Tax=Rhodococcus ruber TaxID=1830 RepID=UPI001F449743|nr:hypothetical protein [Rhodococcus ruber]MCF8783391.1 hypothetical protein [Rhodococcus ruber]
MGTTTDERAELHTRLRTELNAFAHRTGTDARKHWFQLAYEVIGRHRPDLGDPLTVTELRAIVDAFPAYRQRVEAEHAERTAEPVVTAADRLTALEAAIRDGAPITAGELAQARAEAAAAADAVKIAEDGRKAREKTARELAKTQRAALSEVRANLPALPADYDDRIAAAEAAIVAALEVITGAGGYAEQVTTAHRTLAAGGVVPRPNDWETPDGQIDPDNTLDAHGRYIVVDGTVHAPDDKLRALRERLALFALGENFEYRRGKVTRAA